MENQIISDRYLKRCLKTLKEKGAPLDGWKLSYMYDSFGENHELSTFETCDLCGCNKVRYVHVMEHDSYPFEFSVGCICAGVMQGDILKAMEDEKEVRRWIHLRKLFLKRGLKNFDKGTMRFKNEHYKFIKDSNGLYKAWLIGSDMVCEYKGKPIKDKLSLFYAAFEIKFKKPSILGERINA